MFGPRVQQDDPALDPLATVTVRSFNQPSVVVCAPSTRPMPVTETDIKPAWSARTLRGVNLERQRWGLSLHAAR